MIPAKIVTARPETIWFTRMVIDNTAWMRAIAAPATMEARTASSSTSAVAPCVFCETKNAVTAPMSIIPSTPRLSTPERSASSSPRPARTSGVPKAIADTRTAMTMFEFMASPRSRRPLRRLPAQSRGDGGRSGSERGSRLPGR